jgi:ketosteroid isomerase-like protein
MKANAETQAAVLGVLDKFMETYKKRDINGLMSLFPADGDQVMYGTGADEKRIGRDQIKFQAQRDWSQTEALDFNITWQKISATGPIAWVAADGFGKGKAGGQDFQFPFRMTCVLEKQGEKWLLVQSHISLPAAAQGEGDSVLV